MKKVKYDVIGYWSEVKLDIVRDYASKYSIIMNKQKSIKKHLYVDAFAGAGQHISKKTGEFVPGSPLNALLIEPAFSEFHLIDLNGTKAAELRRRLVRGLTFSSTKETQTMSSLRKSCLGVDTKTFDAHCVCSTLTRSTLIGRSSRLQVRCDQSRSSTTS